MGESFSKVDSIERPVKRFKREDQDQNNGSVTTSSGETQAGSGQTTEEVGNVPPEWHQLPQVVLLEIYQHLSNNDKLSASLTCRAWLEPFSRPGHWRRGKFLFNGWDEWRALNFSIKMGASLRHISADCSISYLERKAKLTTKDLATFLNILLQANNFSLVKLKLTNMERLTPHLLRTGCDFLHALVQLLEGQTRLKILDLTNAGLTVDQGLRLLLAVCNNCGETLQSLNIFKLMTPELGLDIGTDGRYLIALSQFVNLSELIVNHSYMSDDVLFLLSAHGKLKDLAIHAEYYYYGRADSRTSEDAWKLLTLKCPDLEVSFVIKGVSHDMSLCDILTPSIPLWLLLWSPASYTTPFNTKNCFQHIASHFQNSLRHMFLSLDSGFLNDEEDIANVIEKCTRLQTLIIDSKMKVQQQIRVERAIRKAVVKQPKHCLKTVIINNEVINLEETWLTSLIGWLVVLVN